MQNDAAFIRWLETLGNHDVALVGGKNASLGEMISTMKSEGIRVPDGFATTSAAYWRFVKENDLGDRIQSLLDEHQRGRDLGEVGQAIRELFKQGRFPQEVEAQLREAYRALAKRFDTEDVDVAVRSSATAEDLPTASFAGQQETYLNVTGEDELVEACRNCYASLFTDRAIIYRENNGFDHMKVALSVGVQKMVRSDKAGAGVLFTLDTESGFPDVVLINAAWGLGENVVQGTVSPDQYMVFKTLLKNDKLVPIIEKTVGTKRKKMIYAGEGARTVNLDTSADEQSAFVLADEEILALARWAQAIENHYGMPMDIEWAKDGERGDLYIVQARPETVQSQTTGGHLKTYHLKEKGDVLLTGLSIGNAIAAGKVQKVESARDLGKFVEGGILVTEMTDPDWVPIMKKAAGIITNTGGRTCHAAIVSRELGIPAVVGSGNATKVLKDDQDITLSCAEGDQGVIYGGKLAYEERDVDLDALPEIHTQIMINAATPGGAFKSWRLPVKGIGLARMEFIINSQIQIHPLALTRYDSLEDSEALARIDELTRGYPDKPSYFVDLLARGIAKIAASQYPHKVIVRMSDFKTNEYAELIGGRQFEPHEENPMLGFRGASRYYHERYRDGFALECRAIHKVREIIGLDNVVVMIPFCRTPAEADKVLAVMAEEGLERGKEGLQVYVMCEIPSNVILAAEFAKRFDGFSIGSNDLTQLVLGVDRDSAVLAELFDERNEAIKRSVADLIRVAHKARRKVGICGEAPSNYPEFAEFLVRHRIDSISLNPDSVVEVKPRIAAAEKKRGK
jgi:pyruvate, water dikinase